MLPLIRSRQDQVQSCLSRLPDFTADNTRVYLGGSDEDVDVRRDLLAEVKKGVKKRAPLYTFKLPHLDAFLLFHCLGCQSIKKSDFQEFCGKEYGHPITKHTDMLRVARRSYNNTLVWLAKHFRDLTVLEATILGDDVEQARRMGRMVVGYRSFYHTYAIGPFYFEYRAASEKSIVGEWRLAPLRVEYDPSTCFGPRHPKCSFVFH